MSLENIWQSNLARKVFADLSETSPRNPTVIPDLYNNNLTFEENITEMHLQLRRSLRLSKRIDGLVIAYYIGKWMDRRSLTIEQRRLCRLILSRHYYDCCKRIYDLYSIQGPDQLHRTKRTHFWMYRTLKKSDYIQLISEAEVLATDALLLFSIGDQ